MSFSEKIAQIMARPGQDPVAKDDVPWWMRYGGRGLGTVGSFLAIFLGFWNCFGIILGNVECLLGGMWQIVAGFIVVSCEAPCCCLFIDHVQRLSDVVENRPYWNKAAGYIILSIPPLIMCFGLASLFGSGLIFATGIIYGMMSIGKKASAEEMRSAAVAETQPGVHKPPPPGVHKPPNSSMHSNLVSNAQPISFTGSPMFDSNV